MDNPVSILDLLTVVPTPLLILVLWVLHKFDVRLVRIETTLENHNHED